MAPALAHANGAQYPERQARSVRGRAALSRRLTIDKGQSLDLSKPYLPSSVDSLAMSIRTLPTTTVGEPKPNAQRNFTDSDSHKLKGEDGWMLGYNCKIAVDVGHQTTVVVGVSDEASIQHYRFLFAGP